MVRADAQTAAEEMHCIRETERLDLFARLAALAATAAYQTRGKVILRRLPPNHPQHARCLRAATENVKPGFFSSESPYSAVDVLDVFKVGRSTLLGRTCTMLTAMLTGKKQVFSVRIYTDVCLVGTVRTPSLSLSKPVAQGLREMRRISRMVVHLGDNKTRRHLFTIRL